MSVADQVQCRGIGSSVVFVQTASGSQARRQAYGIPIPRYTDVLHHWLVTHCLCSMSCSDDTAKNMLPHPDVGNLHPQRMAFSIKTFSSDERYVFSVRHCSTRVSELSKESRQIDSSSPPHPPLLTSHDSNTAAIAYHVMEGDVLALQALWRRSRSANASTCASVCSVLHRGLVCSP